MSHFMDLRIHPTRRQKLLTASVTIRILPDFAETAALIANLDVVISVDTAVAHLAGALGKPTWIMLPAVAPDWRWMLDREDTPWYPTARLFRQKLPGDWTGVIEQVGERHLENNSPNNSNT